MDSGPWEGTLVSWLLVHASSKLQLLPNSLSICEHHVLYFTIFTRDQHVAAWRRSACCPNWRPTRRLRSRNSTPKMWTGYERLRTLWSMFLVWCSTVVFTCVLHGFSHVKGVGWLFFSIYFCWVFSLQSVYILLLSLWSCAFKRCNSLKLDSVRGFLDVCVFLHWPCWLLHEYCCCARTAWNWMFKVPLIREHNGWEFA